MCLINHEIIKVVIIFLFAVISEYCTTSRALFEDVRKNYARLADVVPKNQYYKYHDQWRFVTQKLCFLASLIIYLEIKVLLSKDTAAEMLGGM